MTPFLFILETASAVPLVGRVALAGTLLLTSTVSTTMVGWLGLPYVTKLVWLPAEKPDTGSGGKQAVGVEMTTTTLTLKERITRVYDSAFLVPTNRPLAKWELAEVFKLPQKELEAAQKEGGLPAEETIAETLDKDGNVLGRWIVEWKGDGTGTCRDTGKVILWVPRVESFFRYTNKQLCPDISTSMKSSSERASGTTHIFLLINVIFDTSIRLLDTVLLGDDWLTSEVSGVREDWKSGII